MTKTITLADIRVLRARVDELARLLSVVDASSEGTYDTVKAEEILTATPMMIRTTDGRVLFKDKDDFSGRPTPVRLCLTCDGKKTLGAWDGKGCFEYTTCGACKGVGILPGPEWGVCQHCKKQLNFAFNCCTSCANERGP